MLEYRAILQRAFAGEIVEISCRDNSAAKNLRQKFYRYRDKIRAADEDALNLLVDDLTFGLEGSKILIWYNDKENLVEALNDDSRPGARALKHQADRTDAPSKQRHIG